MVKKVNEIKALRDKLKLSQAEFADKMAVDVTTISRWERGEQRPRPIHLRRMDRLAKRS
jgi:DNA-binding transcriptional regulator YiaG